MAVITVALRVSVTQDGEPQLSVAQKRTPLRLYSATYTQRPHVEYDLFHPRKG